MAENKISYNDLVDEKLSETLRNEMQEILDIFQKTEKGIKQVTTDINKDIKSLSQINLNTKQIEELNEKYKKLEIAYNAMKEVKKGEKKATDDLQKAEQILAYSRSENAKKLAELKLQIAEQNKANKEAALINKENLGAYQKLSIEYANNAKKVKDILASKQTLTQADKELITQTKAQIEELKKIDSAVGQNQRSVGDYTESVKKAFTESEIFSSALGRMGTMGSTLNKIFSALSTQLGNIHSNSLKANEGTGKFGATLKGMAIGAIIASVASLNKMIKETSEGSKEFAKQTGRVGTAWDVTMSSVGKATIGIGQSLLGVFKFDMAEISAGIDKAKHSFDGFVDNLSKGNQASDNFVLLSREIRKQLRQMSGDLTEVTNDVDDQQMRMNDGTLSYKQRMVAMNEYHRLRIREASIEKDMADKQVKLIELEKTLAQAKIGKDMTLPADILDREREALNNQSKAADKLNDTYQENAKDRRELVEKELMEDLELLRSKRKSSTAQHDIILEELKDNKISLEDRQEKAGTLKDLNMKIFNEQIRLIKERLKIDFDANSLLKEQDNLVLKNKLKNLNLGAEMVGQVAFIIKKTQDAEIEADKEIKKLDEERIKRLQKIAEVRGQMSLEELNAMQEEIKQAQEFNKKELKKIDDKLVEDTKENRKKIYDNELYLIEREYNLKAEQITKKSELDKKNAKNTINDQKILAVELEKIDQKTNNELVKNNNEKNNQINEANYKQQLENEKIRQKQITDAFDTEKAIMQGVSDGIKQRADLKEQAVKEEQSINQDNINLQTQRAAQGLDNTLAYELASKQKLAKEEKDIREQEAKEQEAVEMMKLVFTLAEAYAKKDKTGLEAALKASADALLIKGTAKLIGGGFYEGSEGISEDDGIVIPGETKDNIMIRVNKKEKVLGFDDSMKLQGMTNKEIVDSALLMKNGFKLPVISDRTNKENTNDSLNRMLYNKLKDVENAIKNQPSTSINLDPLGTLIEKKIENGITTIIHKRNFIKR